MNSMIFIDTCIVIDYINGKMSIDQNSKTKYCFNSIVDMEVLVGVKQ
jgi:predicted nucleic acid-binding protein